MQIQNIKTYGQSKNKAFETLIVQLFKSYIRQLPNETIIIFNEVNDAGGDGGVEAYAETIDGFFFGVQAKWFPERITKKQIENIQRSVDQAIDVRPKLKEYLIALPRNFRSKTFRGGKQGEGKKLTENNEDELISTFLSNNRKKYPNLKIHYWNEGIILEQLQRPENSDLIRFWFNNEILSLSQLRRSLERSKATWLRLKYVPELHIESPIESFATQLSLAPTFVQNWIEKTSKIVEILRTCNDVIDQFMPTISNRSFLCKRMLVIQRNLHSFIQKFQYLCDQLEKGLEIESKIFLKELYFGRTLLSIDAYSPNNIQKNVIERLRRILRRVHEINIEQYFSDVQNELFVNTLFIKGPPGSGKTHSLAKCTEERLDKGLPALIVNAALNKPDSWKNILEKVLDINGWTEGEIFSGLNSLAQLSNVSNNDKFCFVCIDALDEVNSFQDRKNWVDRINELNAILPHYPSLKFILASRLTFYRFQEIEERVSLKVKELSVQGDMDIEHLKSFYFKEYNIKNVHSSISNQIQTPLELRLFCEEFRGQHAFAHDLNVTTKKLLNLKIERIVNEFKEREYDNFGDQVVHKIIESIAIHFLGLDEIQQHFGSSDISEHLLALGIEKKIVNSTLELLSEHGILIKEFYEDENSLGIKNSKSRYFPAYRSIYELFLIQNIITEVREDRIDSFYKIFKSNFRESMSNDVEPLLYRRYLNSSPWRICLYVVKELFCEWGILIGTDKFNPNDLDPEFIFELKCYALSESSHDIIKDYQEELKEAFLEGGVRQKIVFDLLINNETVDCGLNGSKFLDSILKPLSCFQRDQLWSGKDSYEKQNFQITAHYECPLDNIGLVYSISPCSKFDQKPIILAWGLTSINNKLRKVLKQTLFVWALTSMDEFKKLLLHFKNCNDPQVNEGLSIVMTALSSELNNDEQIRQLASWVYNNLLIEMDNYSSALAIRGFMSPINRALNLGVSSEKDYPKIFNRKLQDSETLMIKDLPVKEIVDNLDSSGFYPIKHDLYWYVFSNCWSYYEPDNHGKPEDWQKFISAYDETYDGIDQNILVLALAIHRIRGLGFDRDPIPGFVSDNRSSIPEIMTYEDKYVWIAVNYVIYYLSKFIRIKHQNSSEGPVVDFSDIIEAETINKPLDITDIVDKYTSKSESRFTNSEWIIPEILTPEVEVERGDSDFKKCMEHLIQHEQKIDFALWINTIGINKLQFVSVYNEISLHDSQKLLYTNLDITCCFIQSVDYERFINYLSKSSSDQEQFQELGKQLSLRSIPSKKSSVALNEIFWKGSESEISRSYRFVTSERVFDLFPSRIEITTSEHGMDSHHVLPSAVTRKIFNLSQGRNDVIIDERENEVVFLHKKTEPNRDHQKGLYIEQSIFEEKILNSEWKPVWIAEYLRRRNVHDIELTQFGLPQKCRKYIIWQNSDKWQTKKVWDGYFSNSNWTSSER